MKRKIWFSVCLFALLSIMAVLSVSALPAEEEIQDQESSIMEEEMTLPVEETGNTGDCAESAENAEPLESVELIETEDPSAEEPAVEEVFIETGDPAAEDLMITEIMEEIISSEETVILEAADLPSIEEEVPEMTAPAEEADPADEPENEELPDAADLVLEQGKGDNENVLSFGMQGEDVLALQKSLYEKGFLTVRPDGVYGSYTQRAVKKYQMYNNLDMTGVADVDTMDLLSDQGGEDFYSLSQGSTGDAVYQLQTALLELGYLSASADGVFGPITYQAVMDFQRDSELSVIDGIAGKMTMEALFRSYSPAGTPSEDDTSAEDSSLIRKGMTGSSVLDLQKKLYNNGFLTAQPDGIFGNYTETALKKFQLYNGLAVSGTADRATLDQISSQEAVSCNTLQTGSSGKAVLNLQRILQELGYLDAEPDGAFGRFTYRAVAAYQADHGLTADGIVGSITSSSLISLSGVRDMTGEKTSQEEEQGEPSGEESSVPAIVQDASLLKKGMTGNDVLSMQQALIRHGYLHAEADGIFGNKTEKALKQFEVYNDLAVTGMVDQTLLSKVLSDSAVPFSVLSEGSKGVSVKGIQKVLYNLGYLTAAPDGIFGSKTKQAVALFQEINDVGSTYGKADQSTANELTDLTDEYEKEMTKLTPQQRNLIRTTYLVPTTAPGLCSGWVSNVLASYGINGSDIVASRDSIYSYAYQNGLTDANYAYDMDFNANDYWAYVCTSDKKEDLKPGMVVATRSTYSYLGRQFGHVGFYLGNNKVISSIGYIELTELEDFDEKYNNKEYGSTMKWGFAPTFLSK